MSRNAMLLGRRIWLIAMSGLPGLTASSLAEEPPKKAASKYTLRSVRCSVARHPQRPTLVTQVVVHVGYKDADRRVWLPVDVMVQDSAGKEWFPDRYAIDDATKRGFSLIMKGEDSANNVPTGWQNPAKWVVVLDCTSRPKGGSEVIVNVPVIPIPKGKEIIRVPLSPEITGKGLASALAFGEEAETPVFTHVIGEANFWIQLANRENWWPSVVSLTDENDRKVKAYFDDTDVKGQFLMYVISVGRSKTMKLTLGLDPIERVRFSN